MGKFSGHKKENAEDVQAFEHRCFDIDWVNKQYQKQLKDEKKLSPKDT
jgi:hypothetical protein